MCNSSSKLEGYAVVVTGVSTCIDTRLEFFGSGATAEEDSAVELKAFCTTEGVASSVFSSSEPS